MSTGTWYHVAITASVANGLKLYLNGAEVASTNVPSMGNSSSYQFKVGGGVWSASSDFLDGFVDDVIVYSRRLTATEISQIYGN